MYLGPIFPEHPYDWPISKVSRFKKKFGATNVTIIQGSFFCRPEKYLEMAQEQIVELCQIEPNKDKGNRPTANHDNKIFRAAYNGKKTTLKFLCN